MTIFCVIFACSVHGGEPPSRKNVLVIYPDSDNRPGIDMFDKALRQSLQSAPEPIEIYNEFLDVSRFSQDSYQKELAEFLKRKYANSKIDLVIAALSPSLDFILKYREVFCPGVPIVHAAV